MYMNQDGKNPLLEIKHLSTLRSYINEMEKSDYVKFKENIEIAISERDARQAEVDAAVHKQAALIAELKAKALEAGIDPILLLDDSSLRARGKVPQKYCYVDENGEEHYWTGRGRTPKIYEELKEKGIDWEDFRIKE